MLAYFGEPKGARCKQSSGNTGLDVPGFGQERIFFAVLQDVETVSGAQAAHSSVRAEEFFSEVKRQGSEFDYSPPSSAEVKNEWSYTSTPRT
jgi:hypothetical protein